MNFRPGEPGRAGISANGSGRERLFARSARVAAALPEQDRGAAVRSHLSHDEIDYFRRLLVEQRRELSGAVDHMADEALGRSRSEAAGDLSMMPLHPADIGTDHYEREFTLGLMKAEKATLQEIDEALERIRAGTFGICLGTRLPIDRARLAAKPWARYSIEYKRLVEARGRK